MENYWLSKFIKYIYIDLFIISFLRGFVINGELLALKVYKVYIYIDLFIISFLRGFVINGELLALKVYKVYIYRSVHNQFPERLCHKWRIIGSQSL